LFEVTYTLKKGLSVRLRRQLPSNLPSGKMTIRETSFRESDHPGIVFPGNVLSGKKTIRETSFREKSFRESDHPGKLLSGKRPYTTMTMTATAMT